MIVTEDTIVNWTATSEFDLVIGLIETIPLGSSDCEDRTGFINPFALGDPCETRGGPLPFVLTPGTYWFFVSTQDFDGFPCGQGPWEYTANLTCTPAIGRLGAPSENDWQAGKSKGAQSTQQ